MENPNYTKPETIHIALRELGKNEQLNLAILHLIAHEYENNKSVLLCAESFGAKSNRIGEGIEESIRLCNTLIGATAVVIMTINFTNDVHNRGEWEWATKMNDKIRILALNEEYALIRVQLFQMRLAILLSTKTLSHPVCGSR